MFIAPPSQCLLKADKHGTKVPRSLKLDKSRTMVSFEHGYQMHLANCHGVTTKKFQQGIVILRWTNNKQQSSSQIIYLLHCCLNYWQHTKHSSQSHYYIPSLGKTSIIPFPNVYNSTSIIPPMR